MNPRLQTTRRKTFSGDPLAKIRKKNRASQKRSEREGKKARGKMPISRTQKCSKKGTFNEFCNSKEGAKMERRTISMEKMGFPKNKGPSGCAQARDPTQFFLPGRTYHT